MKSINKIWKRIAVILFFYLINFGLWELIAPIISDEWASFMVYVILFLIVIALFHRELKEEWDFIRNTKLTDKKYYVGLIITLIIELVLTLVMLWIAQNVWVEILPANNENVKNQISEIRYYPNEQDEDRFLLYMIDGNYVYLTLTKFKQINYYEEVLTKLDGKKGILYLDSGNHFQIMSD